MAGGEIVGQGLSAIEVYWRPSMLIGFAVMLQTRIGAVVWVAAWMSGVATRPLGEPSERKVSTRLPAGALPLSYRSAVCLQECAPSISAPLAAPAVLVASAARPAVPVRRNRASLSVLS